MSWVSQEPAASRSWIGSAFTGAGNAVGGMFGGILRPLIFPLLLLIVLVIALTVLVGRAERAAGALA